MFKKVNNQVKDKAIITYINESGFEAKAIIMGPVEVHHSWYDSKRDHLGCYEKHEITRLGAFMSKLKNCTKIRIRVVSNGSLE